MDDSKKMLAALGYPIGIIGLVMALTENKDKEVKLHGWQGFLWGCVMIVVWIIYTIFASIFFGAMGFGAFGVWGVMSALWTLIWLAWLILAIVFAVKAHKGEKVNIPVITGLAKGFVK